MLPYWGSLCAPGSAELRLFALNICFSRRLCSSPRWARAVPLLARCIVGCPRLCLHFLYLGIFLTTNWSFTPCFLNFCTWGPRICSLAQTARVKVWNVECSKAVVFPCRCAKLRWLLWRLCGWTPLWCLQDAFLLLRHLPTRRVEVPQGWMSKSSMMTPMTPGRMMKSDGFDTFDEWRCCTSAACDFP